MHASDARYFSVFVIDDKKMSFAIYLKNFTGELTNQANAKLNSINQMQLKKDQEGLQSLVGTTLGGLNTLQMITNLCINTCLNDICESKFKAQLTASIFKHLIIFQKFADYSPEPFGTCMESMVSLIMQAL